MRSFKYRQEYLYAEDTRLVDLAKKTGTPAYVYSRESFYNHFSKLNKAFQKIPHLICYSLKANSNLSILRLLAEWGVGADIVSGGELYRALSAGIKPEKIVYAGVGKTEDEITYAIKKGILLFNVESLEELSLINEIALSLGKGPKVCLRINPDIPLHTHQYLTTGKKETKFGISIPDALKIFSQRIKWPGVHLAGIHLHLGSQIIETAPYEKAIKKIVSFIKKDLEPQGISIDFLNIGGGLGIVYDKEIPATPQKFSRKVLPLLKGIKAKLILEPGRFIAGPSGILLTKVIYVKKSWGKKFVIVDSGMNDLIRPSLYNAYHKIIPLIKKKGKREKVDVVGPICESGDFFAKARVMQELKKGDIIAVLSAGAYGFTMSSNYNARPRPPEVLVHGSDFETIRFRETYKDLIRGEFI